MFWNGKGVLKIGDKLIHEGEYFPDDMMRLITSVGVRDQVSPNMYAPVPSGKPSSKKKKKKREKDSEA